MSKIKISINSLQSSVKINDQEINDIITDLSVNIRATQSPTITMTLVPCNLEINGENFDIKSPTSTSKEKNNS